MLMINYTPKLLTPDDMRKRITRGERDITDLLLSLLFPTCPEGRVDIHEVSVLGRPSSGKSTLLEFLTEYAIEKYGELLNITYANGYLVAATNIDDRPVQLVMLDDLSGQVSSRQSGKNTKAIQIGNTIRHILEDKQKENGYTHRGGLVIIIKAWQRSNDLDRAVKHSDFQIWKAPPILMDEKEVLREEIGSEYLDKLDELNYQIYVKKNQKAKSRSVALISALGADNGGIGMFYSRMVEYKLPRILDEEAYLESIRRMEKEEEECRKQQRVPTHAQARVRIPDEVILALAKDGKSIREIADLLPVSKSTVQRKLKDLGHSVEEAIV